MVIIFEGLLTCVHVEIDAASTGIWFKRRGRSHHDGYMADFDCTRTMIAHRNPASRGLDSPWANGLGFALAVEQFQGWV